MYPGTSKFNTITLTKNMKYSAVDRSITVVYYLLQITFLLKQLEPHSIACILNFCIRVVYGGKKSCKVTARVHNIVGRRVSNAQFTMYKPTAASKTSIL